jgi:alcohol dehydrogenase
MGTLKKAVHDCTIAVSKVAFRLFPDRTPLTFLGAGSSRELCTSLAQTAQGRILVVTDEGLVGTGIVGRMTELLGGLGVQTSLYAGVLPDPTFTQVQDGLRQFAAENCTGVLAIGGGSPLDAAKVIAASATNGGDPRRLVGMLKVRRPAAPLAAIPTTAGTGSEVTIAAVISEPDTHEKKFLADPKLLPQMAALDPELMVGLPPAITAATGMDALTHAVESFLAKTSTPATERFAETAVRLVFENLPRAYANGGDLEARKAMAVASYYAGMAFTRTSVGNVHAIAHTLGAYYATPHGHANALALPLVLEFSRGHAEERMARLAQLAGCEVASGKAFIEAVRNLMAEVGIAPTLDDLRATDIPAIARQAAGEAHANYPVPRYMEPSDCEELLRELLTPTASFQA